MYSELRMEKISTIRLLFFESYKRYLKGAASVTLSKYVTHYRPMSGLLYYNVRASPSSLPSESIIDHPHGIGRTGTITNTYAYRLKPNPHFNV